MKLEIGMRVTAEKDGSLVVGDIADIAKGWITVTKDDGTTVKVRPTRCEVFEEDDDGEGSVGNMSKKLAEAKKRYVKVGNTFHNGDRVARALHGMDVPQIAELASKFVDAEPAELVARYSNLNPGQQRMNLGNRIRAAVKKQPELAELLPSSREEDNA